MLGKAGGKRFILGLIDAVRWESASTTIDASTAKRRNDAHRLAHYRAISSPRSGITPEIDATGAPLRVTIASDETLGPKRTIARSKLT